MKWNKYRLVFKMIFFISISLVNSSIRLVELISVCGNFYIEKV